MRCRDKTALCTRCGQTYSITVNLDAGRVMKAVVPVECQWPVRCAARLTEGVFDRRFGERIIRPEKSI